MSNLTGTVISANSNEGVNKDESSIGAVSWRKKYIEINLGGKIANGHEFAMYVLCNAAPMSSIDDVTINGGSICRSGSSFKIKYRLFRILGAVQKIK